MDGMKDRKLRLTRAAERAIAAARGRDATVPHAEIVADVAREIEAALTERIDP
jgi:hypothetical protein